MALISVDISEYTRNRQTNRGSKMDEGQKFHTVRGYQLMEQNKKVLTSAMEDYLEMIYRLSLKETYVRINQISELLNVQAPSVSRMVQKLNDLGFLDYKKYGIVTLTEIGREIGEYLLHRHNIIETFLKNLGVRDNLLIETELIEHTVSDNTLKHINAFNMALSRNEALRVAFYEELSHLD